MNLLESLARFLIVIHVIVILEQMIMVIFMPIRALFTTADGEECADWHEDDHYHLFQYNDNMYYDQESGEAFQQVHASGNKCRNPTDDPKGPYCFTKTDLKVDYQYR